MEADVKRMEAQLALWRTRIDDLTARALKAGPQTSFETHQRIDDLKAKCAITQSTIDKLKLASP